MTLRESPVVAVADLVVRLTPGWLAHYLIERGRASSTSRCCCSASSSCSRLVFAWAGRLARRVWWAPAIVYGALTVVGAVAVVAAARLDHDRRRPGRGRLRDLAGHAVAAHRAAAQGRAARRGRGAGRRCRPTRTPTGSSRSPPASDHTRRTFVIRAGLIAVAAVVLAPPAGSSVADAGTSRSRAGCCGSLRSSEPRGPARRPDRGQGGHALADAERRASTGSTPRSSVPAIEPKDW